MESQKKQVFFIEGNIGSGKSTLLKNIEQSFPKNQVLIVPEPVMQWQDVGGENLLEKFY